MREVDDIEITDINRFLEITKGSGLRDERNDRRSGNTSQVPPLQVPANFNIQDEVEVDFNDSSDFNKKMDFSDLIKKDGLNAGGEEVVDFNEDELVDSNDLCFNCSGKDQDVSMGSAVLGLPQAPDINSSDTSVPAGVGEAQDDLALPSDAAPACDISGTSSVSDVEQSFL